MSTACGPLWSKTDETAGVGEDSAIPVHSAPWKREGIEASSWPDRPDIMARPPKSRFRHTRKGVRVNLAGAERNVLGLLFEQFRQLLFSGADPDLACLEPPACLDDPLIELEYRAMAANQLLKHRLEAIEVAEAGLRMGRLDTEMVSAWLQTLNGLRLYLSERLELHDSSEFPWREVEHSGSSDEQARQAPRSGERRAGPRGEGEARRVEQPDVRKEQEQADDGAGESVFDKPSQELLVVYHWLGELLEQLVGAASEGLTPDPEDA